MAGTTRGLQVIVTGDVAGLQRALKQAQGEVTTFARTAGKAGARLQAVGAGMRRVGSTLTRGVTLPILAVAGAAVKVAVSFEQQMSRVKAATGAGAKGMEALRQAALKAGADTAYSAQEAAVAQTELAKGGLSAATILKGALAGSLSLAAAGELELGEAASTTVNALQAFGLKGAQATTVADALAKAANVTTADVADFGMALKQVGGVANTAGLTFHQTVTGLEALAAAGVKNSDAGTSMKAAIQQLLGPSEKQKSLQNELGLSFVTSAGKMKGAASIAGMLRQRLGGMTQAQRLATLKTLAGADGVRYLTSLYQAGRPTLERFSRGLHDQGYAADVARTKQDNLAGKLEQLKGSLETAGIVIGSALLPPLTDLAVKVTGVVNSIATAFQGLSPSMQQTVLIFAGIAAAIGPAVWALGGLISVVGRVRAALVLLPGGAILPLIAAFGLLSGNARLVQAALGALAGAMVGGLIARFAGAAVGALQFVRALMSVGGAATAAGLGLARLRVAIASNPIGLLLTALGAVIGALFTFGSSTDRAKLSQQQLADSVLQTRDAIDRLRDADLMAAEAQVRRKEAELNLRRAVQERTRVDKAGRSTALQKREADVAVKRAQIDLERATRTASRASRDQTATRRKDVSEVREAITARKAHYQAIIDEANAQLNNGITAMKLSGSERDKLRAKIAAAEKGLGRAEGAERKLAAAMRDGGDDALTAGGKMALASKGPDKLRGSMQNVGNVHPSFSSFLGSINGALATAWNVVNAAVQAIRDRLAQASPDKKGSPAPTEIVAKGFDELNSTVGRGFASVARTADAGVADFREAVFPIEAEIRELTAAGSRLERAFERADAHAQKRQLKRRAGRKIQDVPGKKRPQARARVQQHNQDVRAARDELRAFKKEQSRASQLRKIEVKIEGLERVRAFRDALVQVRDQVTSLADEAAEKFRQVREQAIDAGLEQALAAFDPAQAARRKVALDKETASVIKLRAASEALSRQRENRQQKRAVEDADRGVTDAERALAAAQTNLDRMMKSQSPRLIEQAQLEFDEAQRGLTDAQQAAADARVDIEETARQRQVEKLEDSIGARQQKLQDAAEDEKTLLDGEVETYKTSLQTQLVALVANLQARTTTYKKFAQDVQAILGPLGLTFAADSELEGALTFTGHAKKKGKKKGKGKASGGLQMMRARLARVGELGAEDVMLPRGARVVPASRSRGDHAGSIHYWTVDARGSGITVDQLLTRAAAILDRKGL